MQQTEHEAKQDDILKAFSHVLSEIDSVETTLHQMQDPQEMLKKTSMDLASTIDQISSLLLDRFQMKQNVEQVAENLAALDAMKEDLEDSLAKWKKRNLPALAENYLGQAKISKQQSEEIRKQAQESEVKLNMNVELLVSNILKKEANQEGKNEESKERELDNILKAQQNSRARHEAQLVMMKREIQEMTQIMRCEEEQLMKMTKELKCKEEMLHCEMDQVSAQNEMMDEKARMLQEELARLKQIVAEKVN